MSDVFVSNWEVSRALETFKIDSINLEDLVAIYGHSKTETAEEINLALIIRHCRTINCPITRKIKDYAHYHYLAAPISVEQAYSLAVTQVQLTGV